MRAVLLFPITAIYYLLYLFWDLYWKIIPAKKVPSRVISVGNIAVGGTGKTSLVTYIASKLRSRSNKTAIAARGYKRPSSSSMVICDSANYDWELCGDEAAAMSKSLGNVKIYVDSNKTRAATKASVDRYDAVIIDDGFQHRKLFRDLDIVCIDGKNPFGNRLLLPSGILREPVAALKRADAFVVFAEQNDVDISILKLPAEKPVFKARKIIKDIKAHRDEAIDLSNKRVIGFCGIANPDSFYNTLESTGLDIAIFKKYKDHHIYNIDDIRQLLELMEKKEAEVAVTTLKDFVKLEKLWPPESKLCYIKINLAIDNEDEFIRLIRNE